MGTSGPLPLTSLACLLHLGAFRSACWNCAGVSVLHQGVIKTTQNASSLSSVLEQCPYEPYVVGSGPTGNTVGEPDLVGTDNYRCILLSGCTEGCVRHCIQGHTDPHVSILRRPMSDEDPVTGS